MINEYLEYMTNIKGRADNTVSAYEQDLNIFFDFLKDRFKKKEIGIKELNKITITDLHAFISFLSNDRGNSNKSKARRIACLKSYFKYLQSTLKIIDSNPTLELETPKLERRLPVYLKLEDAEKLLSVIDNKRDYCIITLFLNCGLRLSELVNINTNDLQGDILTVIGKGNKERTIYLNDSCLDALKAYKEVRGEINCDALFLSNRNMRMTSKGVQSMLEKYLNKAGLKGYSPHKLRHTAATLMYQSGTDIRALQEILGHESVATTQIYTHIDNKQLKEAVKNNPLNRRK
jgi:integrase/recombinase XerD